MPQRRPHASHHPAVPLSAGELACDPAACVSGGARAIRLQPRDDDGRALPEAAVVDAVVARARDAGGLPVGVSMGAWMKPDLAHRAEPDHASGRPSSRAWRELGAGPQPLRRWPT